MVSFHASPLDAHLRKLHSVYLLSFENLVSEISVYFWVIQKATVWATFTGPALCRSKNCDTEAAEIPVE